MNGVNVTVRVDKDIKKQAEVLFNDLGLNLSSAINMFLCYLQFNFHHF